MLVENGGGGGGDRRRGDYATDISGGQREERRIFQVISQVMEMMTVDMRIVIGWLFCIGEEQSSR